MRDKVNVFYYPSMVADLATLKKCILLFDEIHFIDRPSFTFGDFGTIATASPLRAYEESFRKEGVQLYVHSPRDGPVSGEFLEQVKSDVNDLEFLRRFQKGLKESATFCGLQIAPGNYGEVGNEDDVARALATVNVDLDFRQYETPMRLFLDKSIRHFRFETPVERAKALVTDAVKCSAMMNFALNVSQEQGIVPLADAEPYRDLLSVKYARAVRLVENAGSKIQLTDLSFAILDEVVPANRLEQLNLQQIVDYRKETESAREAFLEHLAALHAKQGGVAKDGDYSEVVRNIVVGEIVPEARKFKSQIDGVYEKLFGALAVGAIGALGAGPTVLQFLGDLSWPNICHLAGVAGAAIGSAAINAAREIRAARRECAVSYLLGLDK